VLDSIFINILSTMKRQYEDKNIHINPLFVGEKTPERDECRPRICQYIYNIPVYIRNDSKLTATEKAKHQYHLLGMRQITSKSKFVWLGCVSNGCKSIHYKNDALTAEENDTLLSREEVYEMENYGYKIVPHKN
jgi:hypothetical protein